MIYIIHENNRIPITRYRDPNRSFGPAITEQILTNLGYLVYDPSVPRPEPGEDQRVEHDGYNEQGQDVWNVVDLTPEEIDERKEQERQGIERETPLAAVKRMLRDAVGDVELLDLKQQLELVSAYEQWRPDGREYESGTVLGYGPATLIRVIQTHTSQPGWLPENEESLYQILTPDAGGTYDQWQDWGGNNANLYQTGDRVTHNGQNWESKVDDNHWEPSVENWAAWDLLSD